MSSESATSVYKHPAKHIMCSTCVHAATIQTGHDMPAGLASMTQILCCAYHILITVMCMLLLHVLHMHSLRVAPQCPTFH